MPPMQPAQLPTVPAYLASLSEGRRRALWAWLAALPAELRRGARVLDLSPGSDPILQPIPPAEQQ
jgi:hypothetical protein